MRSGSFEIACRPLLAALLGTLALAYHKTGDVEKAVEVQQSIIPKLPADNPWARPFAQSRLEVYSGDLRYDID